MSWPYDDPTAAPWDPTPAPVPAGGGFINDTAAGIMGAQPSGYDSNQQAFENPEPYEWYVEDPGVQGGYYYQRRDGSVWHPATGTVLSLDQLPRVQRQDLNNADRMDIYEQSAALERGRDQYGNSGLNNPLFSTTNANGSVDVWDSSLQAYVSQSRPGMMWRNEAEGWVPASRVQGTFDDYLGQTEQVAQAVNPGGTIDQQQADLWGQTLVPNNAEAQQAANVSAAYDAAYAPDAWREDREFITGELTARGLLAPGTDTIYSRDIIGGQANVSERTTAQLASILDAVRANAEDPTGELLKFWTTSVLPQGALNALPNERLLPLRDLAQNVTSPLGLLTLPIGGLAGNAAAEVAAAYGGQIAEWLGAPKVAGQLIGGFGGGIGQGLAAGARSQGDELASALTRRGAAELGDAASLSSVRPPNPASALGQVASVRAQMDAIPEAAVARNLDVPTVGPAPSPLPEPLRLRVTDAAPVSVKKAELPALAPYRAADKQPDGTVVIREKHSGESVGTVAILGPAQFEARLNGVRDPLDIFPTMEQARGAIGDAFAAARIEKDALAKWQDEVEKAIGRSAPVTPVKFDVQPVVRPQAAMPTPAARSVVDDPDLRQLYPQETQYRQAGGQDGKGVFVQFEDLVDRALYNNQLQRGGGKNAKPRSPQSDSAMGILKEKYFPGMSDFELRARLAKEVNAEVLKATRAAKDRDVVRIPAIARKGATGAGEAPAAIPGRPLGNTKGWNIVNEKDDATRAVTNGTTTFVQPPKGRGMDGAITELPFQRVTIAPLKPGEPVREGLVSNIGKGPHLGKISVLDLETNKVFTGGPFPATRLSLVDMPELEKMTLPELVAELSPENTAALAAKLGVSPKDLKEGVLREAGHGIGEEKAWINQFRDAVADQRVKTYEAEVGSTTAALHPDASAPGGRMKDANFSIAMGKSPDVQIAHVDQVTSDALKAIGRNADNLDVPRLGGSYKGEDYAKILEAEDAKMLDSNPMLQGFVNTVYKTKPASTPGRVKRAGGTAARKTGRAVGETIGFAQRPLTIMGDLMVGRQGIRAFAGRPITTAKATVRTIPRAYFGQANVGPVRIGFANSGPKWAEKRLLEIGSSERGISQSAMGVRIPRGSDPLGIREDQFMFNAWSNLPIIKQTVGALYKRAELANQVWLAELRMDLFDAAVRSRTNGWAGLGSKARTLDENELRGIASVVNGLTGYGTAKGLDKAAPVLNAMFLSPRLNVARVKMFTDPVFARGSQAKLEAAQSLVGMAGMGLAVAGIAKLAGLDVGIDPKSTNWGKVTVNGVSYDLLNGFQQPIRLFMQLNAGQNIGKNVQRAWNNPDPRDFDVNWGMGERITSFGNRQPQDWHRLLGDFVSSKMTPPAKALWEEFIPSNYVDQDTLAQKFFIPLFIAEAINVWKTTGGDPLQSLLTAGYLFAGGGVNAAQKTGWDDLNNALRGDESLRRFLKAGETEITYQNLDTDGKYEVQLKYKDLYAGIPEPINKDILAKQKTVRDIRDAALAQQEKLDALLMAGRNVDVALEGEIQNPRDWREIRSTNKIVTRAALEREYNDIPPDDTSLFSRYFDAMASFTLEGQYKVNYEAFEQWIAQNLTTEERGRIDAYFRTKGQTTGTFLEREYNRVTTALDDAGYWEMRDRAWAEYSAAEGITAFKTYAEWKHAYIDSMARDLVTRENYDPRIAWQDAEKEFNKVLAKSGRGPSWNDVVANHESKFIASNVELAKDAIWWQFLSTNQEQSKLFSDPSAAASVNKEYARQQQILSERANVLPNISGHTAFADVKTQTATNLSWHAQLKAQRADYLPLIKSGAVPLGSEKERIAAGLTNKDLQEMIDNGVIKPQDLTEDERERLGYPRKMP